MGRCHNTSHFLNSWKEGSQMMDVVVGVACCGWEGHFWSKRGQTIVMRSGIGEVNSWCWLMEGTGIFLRYSCVNRNRILRLCGRNLGSKTSFLLTTYSTVQPPDMCAQHGTQCIANWVTLHSHFNHLHMYLHVHSWTCISMMWTCPNLCKILYWLG